MMVRLSIAVSLFLLAVGLAVPKAEARRLKLLREHEQWEQLVKKRVDSFKSGRVVAEGVNDETAHIQDIQSYYRETLDSNDGWVDGTGVAKAELKMQSSDDEGALNAKSSFRQKTIEGRYIVNLAPGSSDRVLERMTHILEQATAATRQSLRADHIEPFQHVGKGFTATLNKNMVELVRSGLSVSFGLMWHDPTLGTHVVCDCACLFVCACMCNNCKYVQTNTISHYTVSLLYTCVRQIFMMFFPCW